jgi:hypothetical protein
MKTSLILGCILILENTPAVRAQQLTMDDPNYSLLSQLVGDIGWYRVEETKAWDVADGANDGPNGARCMATLNQLRAARVPDTRTIEVRWDAPGFKAGVHTLAEIRTSCAGVERTGRIKTFEKWAILSMQDAGRHDDYPKLCIQAYDQIVKAGVSPADRVPDRVIGGAAWSGTIEELRKKWCESGLSKANDNAAAR